MDGCVWVFEDFSVLSFSFQFYIVLLFVLFCCLSFNENFKRRNEELWRTQLERNTSCLMFILSKLIRSHQCRVFFISIFSPDKNPCDPNTHAHWQSLFSTGCGCCCCDKNRSRSCRTVTKNGQTRVVIAILYKIIESNEWASAFTTFDFSMMSLIQDATAAAAAFAAVTAQFNYSFTLSRFNSIQFVLI